MDSTGDSSIERKNTLNGSESDHSPLADNDVPALSHEDFSHHSKNDSVSPTVLQSQVRRLLLQNPGIVEAASQHIPYDSSCVVDDEDVGFDGRDDVVDENKHLEEQELHQVNIYPGTDNLCDPSSEEQSLLKLEQYRNATQSEGDTYSVQEPASDELDRLSIGTSDYQDGWSSEHDSDISVAKKDAPVIVSWKDLPVSKSEIPLDLLKQTTSVVSDFGDRGFYANLNATGRKSEAYLDLDDDDIDLAGLDLQDRFFDVLVRVHQEKKGFFPRALLATMVTEKCVFDELSRCLGNEHNESTIQKYAKEICEEIQLPVQEDDNRPPKTKSFKKIFAILVMVEKTSSIIKFLEGNVNDLELPLVRYNRNKSGSRFDLRISRLPRSKLECFQNWTQAQIQAFENWQWTAISPFFHKGSCKDVQHFPLHGSVMLPFTVDSRRSESRTEIEGGYGRVFKVVIHPDHHNFTDLPKNRCFAVKRLNSPKEEDFKQEVEMLKMFSDNAHPHLISLLATYEQFGVYYLIFPWADGDLNDFWSVKMPNPSLDKKTIMWVAQQCEGIASGLLKIHRYTSNSKNPLGTHEKRYGRHGDLTPRNILWFADSEGCNEGGMLKICDFGLSEYSTVHSKSYRPKTGVATSMSYRPPESDLKGGKIGQSSDIWTLGCLYLEFITWLLGGYELVKKFASKRSSFDPMWSDMDTDNFFELVECPKIKRAGAIAAMVKPAVTEFIMQDLHAHPSCNEFLHDFLNMIRLDMLIVKPTNRAEKGRISCEQVYASFETMRHKCQDLDYLCKAAPWTNNSDMADEVVEVDLSDSAAELLHRKKFRHYEGPIQERPRPDTLAVPGISRKLSCRV